jgi:hypothetical protein
MIFETGATKFGTVVKKRISLEPRQALGLAAFLHATLISNAMGIRQRATARRPVVVGIRSLGCAA